VRPRITTLVAVAVMVAVAHAPSALAAPPLRALEVIREVEVELPPGVELNVSGNAELAPDNRHILLRLTVDGAEQVGLVNLRGKRFSCLTCGHAESATKAKFFEDDKRLWFGNTSGQTGGEFADFQWSVLECSPSIYRCAEAVVLPVEFPLPGLPQAQNREANPLSDDEYVGWNEVRSTEGTRMSIGRLVREQDRYRITDVRVINPAYTLDGGIGDVIHGSRFYEGGETVDGGRTFKYQTTTSALNYDSWALDLATGRRAPLTTDLDYNEITSYSPDGQWVFYSSARGLDRMDVFTQLVRPPLLDMASFGQVGRIALTSNRRCMNEGWLMDRHFGQRRGGYGGQPAVLGTDWNLRSWDWFDSGHRALTTEQRLPNRTQPADPAKRFRLRIVRVAGLPMTEPLSHVELDETAWQSWTVPAADYQGMASRQISGLVVPGPHSGTATLEYSGVFSSGSWSVTFDGYSADGRTYVTGTESITTPLVVGAAVYSADLTATGEHEGSMRASLVIGPQNRVQGSISSEVDGQRLEGIPRQADCPGIREPALRVTVINREPVANGGRRLRVRVTARVPEDRRPRPVLGVLVGPVAGADGTSARTNRRGIAVIRVRGPAGVTALAGGFASGPAAGEPQQPSRRRH
jgi:hypothetical protein